MSRWTVRWMALGLAAAMILAGCSDAGETKAGGIEPITLRLAAMETSAAAPYAGYLEDFSRQVEDLSAGALRIDIVWEAAQEYLGEYGPDAEQDVARLIADGEIDLGLVPARGWDRLGVTSLQALQAPFLIDSEALLAEVLNSELPAKMLAGLDSAGVVGLALLPESLRHPIGFDRPFLTLADFAGATMQAPLSDVSFDLLRTLGAEPVTIAEAVTIEDLGGAETAFALSMNLRQLGTFTANITFYPKVNTLVAGQATFAGLAEGQQAILRQAAANTLERIDETLVSDADAAASYCREGGGVTTAEPADVAALQQAAEPVSAELERDDQTRAFIERIRTMKEQAVPPSEQDLPVRCELGSDDAPDPTAQTSEPTEFPEGVYRAPCPDGACTAQTLTLEAGQWRHDSPPAPPCEGTYAIETDRISFILGTPICGAPEGYEVFNSTWLLQGDEFRFTDVSAPDAPTERIFGEPIWTKIG